MFCSMSPFLEMAYILHGVSDLKVDNKNFLFKIIKLLFLGGKDSQSPLIIQRVTFFIIISKL
jgi:hypothetical protein